MGRFGPALRRLGFAGKMTAHGFRASAGTLAAERLRIDERILELQISHKVSDALGWAYNRTQFLDERVAFTAVMGRLPGSTGSRPRRISSRLVKAA